MSKHLNFKTLIFFATMFLMALPAQAQYLCGDADGGGDINVADVSYLVEYLFFGGPEPVPYLAGDCDADGAVNIADLTYLVAYLFNGGPAPCTTPTGTLVGYTGCKAFSKEGDSIPPTLDCMEYEYDGASVLSLKHVNAGFNCCPSSIEADITIENNLIIIDESESFDTLGPCFCLCLFDLDMEIIDLPPGEYTIRVNELYLNPGDEILEFTVVLSSSPDTGSHCIFRDYYPWGYYLTVPVNSGECKTFQKTTPPDSTPPNQSCIEYQYDGLDVLSITHRNAGFNCCPDELAVIIGIDGNVITIEEVEYLYGGGCDCLCLFDLDYEITGLPPGEYTVEVVEPYRHPDDEPLEFTINLPSSPDTGSHCVFRDHYPWGTYVTAPVVFGECKEFQKTSPPDSTPPNQSCIEYQYDGQNVLSINHRNAGFNCCPDELAAVVSVLGNVITIEEVEFLYGGGCFCLCLFDLAYEIVGLPPGEYTVNVIEPYRDPDDEPLEFTISLSSSPSSGGYCVFRSHYPWGGY